jgi:hypothetical protein
VCVTGHMRKAEAHKAAGEGMSTDTTLRPSSWPAGVEEKRQAGQG